MSPQTDYAAEIGEEILSRCHRHVLFLVGAAISCSAESKCASVGAIQRDLVFNPLVRRLGDDARHLAVVDKLLAYLPFEQLLGCLHVVNPTLAESIIERACPSDPSSQPNGNHLLVMNIAKAMLEQGVCNTVTVATTNYDQCLERAIALPLEPIQIAGSLRVTQATIAGGTLRYIKLHGCNSDMSSCVFTMRQLFRLTLDSRALDEYCQALTNPVPPSLAIAMCYSFSDPDLEPVWDRCLDRNHAKLYWNEVPPRKGDQAEERLFNLAGPSYLRARRLRRLAPRVHLSSLFQPAEPGRPHMLVALASRLGLQLPDVPKFERLPPGISDAVRQYWEATPQDDCREIASRILDSFSKGEARFILEAVVKSGRATPSQARLYVEAFGHAADIHGDLKAARGLIRQYRGSDIETIGRSMESFALTIQGGKTTGDLIRNGVAAIRTIVRAWSRVFRQSADVRALLGHYTWHFLAKSLQKSYLMCPARPLRLPLKLGAWIMGWLIERRIRSTARILEEWRFSRPPLLDVRDVVAEGVLASQMSLLGGNVRGARRMISDAVNRSAAAGWLNGFVQADRTNAWILAATGSLTEANAIAMLALRRALETADLSLSWKLAADVLRFAWNDHKEQIQDVDDRAIDDSHVKELIDAWDTVPKRQPTKREVADIARWLRSNHFRWNWESLVNDIRNRSDYSLYPIFLPPEPQRERA